MSQGHIRKYLLYAIGEVLLVVFGILIALQINNWNQNRKDKALEASYLNRLQQDLQKDSSMLELHFNYIEVKADILNSILKGELDAIYSDNSPKNIFMSRFRTPPTISTTTFDDLLSTGNIGILKDITLRENIIDYYNYGKRQEKVLNNKLSNWSQTISELIPGEMGFLARSGREKPTPQQIIQLKENLANNRLQLEPVINAELNYTGLQYYYHQECQRRCLELLDLLRMNIN